MKTLKFRKISTKQNLNFCVLFMQYFEFLMFYTILSTNSTKFHAISTLKVGNFEKFQKRKQKNLASLKIHLKTREISCS